MSAHDRDLAEAILRELSSDVSAARAALAWADTKDMRRTLAHVAAVAIEAVLARRLREAARAGPWSDYDEEEGYPWVMLPRKRTP
jgi:hypothetical protein